MDKDFDTWNQLKKKLEIKELIFCNPREIWWCSVGVNIGAETCGKNELFERPVIILKVYNLQSILVAPLTSKSKSDLYHIEISYGTINGWVILSHTRTISPKRLQRKLTRINIEQFEKVKEALFSVMKLSENESAPELTGASEPEGLMGIAYQEELFCQVATDPIYDLYEFETL